MHRPLHIQRWEDWNTPMSWNQGSSRVSVLESQPSDHGSWAHSLREPGAVGQVAYTAPASIPQPHPGHREWGSGTWIQSLPCRHAHDSSPCPSTFDGRSCAITPDTERRQLYNRDIPGHPPPVTAAKPVTQGILDMRQEPTIPVTTAATAEARQQWPQMQKKLQGRPRATVLRQTVEAGTCQVSNITRGTQ